MKMKKEKRQVKLVLVRTCCDYDQNATNIIQSGITDWEEVTAEEYNFLEDNLQRMLPNIPYDSQVVLCEKDTIPIETRIANLKKAIQENIARVEAERAERARKKAEKEAKKLAKTQEDKKRLLEQLKKELQSE